MLKLLTILTLTLTIIAGGGVARAQEITAEQKEQIAQQRKVIEDLERQLAEDELRLKEIKQDKSNALKRVNSITKQIKLRTSLLSRTENEIISIEKNIAGNESKLKQTQQEYDQEREKYAEMVREAYRNYKSNNYVIYMLASRDFTDAARRMANIRAMATLREKRMQRMDSLQQSLSSQQEKLALRRHSLDSVQRKAEQQRKKLQSDVKSAQKTMNSLSSKEKSAR